MMYSIFVLLILASSISALPVATPKQMTPDLLKKSLEPLLAFDKYLDDVFLTALRTVFNSDQLLQQASDFMNRINNKSLKRPTDHEETVRMIEAEYPELGQIFRAMAIDYDNKYKSLSEDTKKFLDTIEKRFDQMGQVMENASDELRTTGKVENHLNVIRAMTKLFLDNYNDYLALPADKAAELKQNWPKITEFFHSNVYSSLVRMVEKTQSMSDQELNDYISKFNNFL